MPRPCSCQERGRLKDTPNGYSGGPMALLRSLVRIVLASALVLTPGLSLARPGHPPALMEHHHDAAPVSAPCPHTGHEAPATGMDGAGTAGPDGQAGQDHPGCDGPGCDRQCAACCLHFHAWAPGNGLQPAVLPPVPRPARCGLPPDDALSGCDIHPPIEPPRS